MQEISGLPEHVLAGVSGGADSVALLHLLIGSGARVTAVHVNHGLRGAASDGDEAFVRDLCAKWNVPLLCFRAVPPDHPGEDWARQARYGFFRQAMEASGAQALVLAHHRDDQAETLLLHLLRGAGMQGLTGMAADTTVQGMRILRPLLGASRQELRGMLTAIGQEWREDASNGDPRYLRNALRGEVLPALERLCPGAAERLATTASLLRADEDLLAAQTAVFLADHGEATYLPLAALQTQPLGMRRRILRAWWRTHAGIDRPERALSAEQTEALATLIDGRAGQRCNLPGGWHGQRGWTHLHLIPPGEATVMPETSPEKCGFLKITPFSGGIGDGKCAQALPSALLDGLTVRTRQPGDWISPFGSSGRQSLQDYLVNRRVDAPFRDRVPLLCRGSEVLLAGGVGAGGIPRLTNTEEAVLLTWTEDFAWNPPRHVPEQEENIHDGNKR